MSRPSCGILLFKNVLMLQTLITQRHARSSLKEIKCASAGMNTVINRLVILSVELFFLKYKRMVFLVFVYTI